MKNKVAITEKQSNLFFSVHGKIKKKKFKFKYLLNCSSDNSENFRITFFDPSLPNSKNESNPNFDGAIDRQISRGLTHFSMC
jgi:hypothetical protein